MITTKPSHYGSSQLFSFTLKNTHKQNFSKYISLGNTYTCIALSSFASSPETPKWDSKIIQFSNGTRNLVKSRTQNKKKEGEEELLVGFGERKVKCEVEVISWRERRIKAEISVNADVESVWNALTDYERLADFIPNLVRSGRIPCPHPGRIWLEQRGLQRALYWHIEARVVLDLQEVLKSENDRELHFSMVDGDFKKFEGKWSVKSRKGPKQSADRGEGNFTDLEILNSGNLPVNLQALACRSESNFEGNQNAVSQVSSNTSLLHSLSLGSIEIEGATPIKKLLRKSLSKLLLVLCPLRLENGGVHRCVVACITVKAPVREVWNILTAYESLPEIVPNLAISKVLSRENNKVRILQEGCKGLLYMVLHARVVLDLIELREQEIKFEQVEGDFDAFRGKWILEKLGSHHTLLKYSVESKMHKNSFLSEAIMEEDTLNNDSYAERQTALPINRSSYSFTVEAKDSNCISSLSRQRPKVPGLQRDIEVLKSELLSFISEHGQEGFMPMRKQLRKHGRVDIEKAITRMGGFRRIASLMNLSLAYKHRKPKGRYDIARALEKWGGLHEVSRLLSLKVRHPNRQATLAKEKKSEYPSMSVHDISCRYYSSGDDDRRHEFTEYRRL
ncbi:hypothetical protein DH2020_037884 [Rehmannia glutinosa]|uniref:Coenzyme Q-binding protein COQ10 START domain-containing protein n=1 Tax=Rehmannia glutinosa TaxID=99300 RepID=A0ABR0V0C4_REHGL